MAKVWDIILFTVYSHDIVVNYGKPWYGNHESWNINNTLNSQKILPNLDIPGHVHCKYLNL